MLTASARSLFASAAWIVLASRMFVFGAAYLWLGFDTHRVTIEPSSSLWHGDTGGHGAAAEPWRRWDALWFLQTARHGYVFDSSTQSNTSVFPLYPATIAAVTRAGIDEVWAGVLISNVCLYVATVFMLMLAEGVVDPSTARRAALALLLFPSAFVLSGVYSESMFLMASLATLQFARERRWALTGVSGLAASLTRLAGIALVVPVAIEFARWRHDAIGWRRHARWLLLVPAGTLIFFVLLQIETGAWSNYFNAQVHWQKALDWPWVGFQGETAHWRWRPAALLNIGPVVMVAALLPTVYRKFGAVWGGYTLAGLMLPVCASSWMGMPRYVLMLFPAFVAIADLLRPRWLYVTYLAGSSAAMLWLFRQFLNWKISL
jgi:Gpi18-like mannosyltransferase